MNSIVKFFTSLRLTVALLGISVALIFMGSIAQIDEGLWDAQVRWFQKWVVIRHAGDPLWVPPIFPGGHLIGALLVVNLIAAHIKRFHWSFNKFGIQLTHFGVIVMLIGQLVTDERKVESYMNLKEGESKTYTESHRDAELVFLHEAGADAEEAVSFPQAAVEDQATLQHAKLPFTVKVLNSGENGDVLSLSQVPTVTTQLKRAMDTLDAKFAAVATLPDIATADAATPMRAVVWRKALADVGEKDPDIVAGATKVAKDPDRAAKLAATLKETFRDQMVKAWTANGGEIGYVAKLFTTGQLDSVSNLKPIATEGFGASEFLAPLEKITDDNKGRNMAWAVIEMTDKEGGKPLGRWLVSSMFNQPQEFEVGGKKWRVAMRFARYYVPFKITLVRARQDVYQGTTQAKEYASEVRVENPQTGENRTVQISMNFPLRYSGLTFYQSTMAQRDGAPGVASMLEAFTGRPKSDFIDREQTAAGRESGLQVVENPSMLTPYSGCILVGFGMLWQFLLHLTGFLSKRTGLPAPGYGVAHPILPVCALLIVVPDLFLSVVAFREGTLFILAILAVTPLIRCVLAFQVWKARYHIFTMVFLLVASMLMLVFAIKYHQEYGALLWPIVSCQLAAFIGLAFVVFTAPAPKKAAVLHA